MPTYQIRRVTHITRGDSHPIGLELEAENAHEALELASAAGRLEMFATYRATELEAPAAELTPAELTEARTWLAELTFCDLEPEVIAELPAAQIVGGIARHYEGGLEAFRAELEAAGRDAERRRREIARADREVAAEVARYRYRISSSDGLSARGCRPSTARAILAGELERLAVVPVGGTVDRMLERAAGGRYVTAANRIAHVTIERGES